MEVLITTAIKRRIQPTDEQKDTIVRMFGACRFVYNRMLDRNEKAYRRRGEHQSFADMCRIITGMKSYEPWLGECDARALQLSARNLDRAYQNFFAKRAEHPRFKEKHGTQSYTTGGVIRVKNGSVQLPKLGKVKSRGMPELPEDAKICEATVALDTDGHYYISVIYKTTMEIEPVIPDPDKVIGLDYKSTGLFVTSDGVCAGMPHWFSENQTELARLQRRLSKKELHSESWNKLRCRISKKQRHIANRRRDFLNKVSRMMTDLYDAVCVENLDLQEISQNLNLGKNTYDNGYGEFLRMLEYKLKWSGKQLVKISQWFP